MSDDKLAAAEAKVRKAQATADLAADRVKEAHVALEVARDNNTNARQKLNAAVLARDALLPQATVLRHSRHSHVAERIPVVLVKRTDKTATVRNIGAEGTYQFRKDKVTGVWKEYPAPKRCFPSYWITLKLKD